jgi:Uncharacterized phage-associated protein
MNIIMENSVEKTTNVFETISQVSSQIVKRLENVSPLKLQKIFYYVCAYYYTLEKKHIHSNQEIEFEAWTHGPVNVYLYNTYKEDYTKHALIEYDDTKHHTDKLNDEEVEFINSVADAYKDFSGVQLETLTHMETPWKEKRIGLPEFSPSNEVISYDTILEYYEDKVSYE